MPTLKEYDNSKIWTTLLTNRAYFGGLLVLNHTLRKTQSKYQLKVMITPAVKEDTEYMQAFEAAGIPTIIVENIEPAPRDGRVNKGTWEKLAPWRFTNYEVRWCNSQISRSKSYSDLAKDSNLLSERTESCPS